MLGSLWALIKLINGLWSVLDLIKTIIDRVKRPEDCPPCVETKDPIQEDLERKTHRQHPHGPLI